MSYRVTRLMEYTYDTLEEAVEDAARWFVPANGTAQPRASLTIRSAVLAPTSVEEGSPEITVVSVAPKLERFKDAGPF